MKIGRLELSSPPTVDSSLSESMSAEEFTVSSLVESVDFDDFFLDLSYMDLSKNHL